MRGPFANGVALTEMKSASEIVGGDNGVKLVVFTGTDHDPREAELVTSGFYFHPEAF
jgi:hypothetical protein